ncbi:MAG: sigma-70 family RNA polymerase sigma factor [Candidatus Schekmanbacteria bacterium]|nr:sigma-70 family RNA polymerase sigma factor [Candidatus Schekmanbacteria bacterium]
MFLDRSEKSASPVLVDDVRRAQGGDLVAFERLYRDNAGRIHALCLRMTGNRASAEELTQEVFIRAWERLSTFMGRSSFASWVYRIGVNVSLDAIRADRRDEARLGMDSLEPGGGGTWDQAGASDCRLDLERAISRLPPGARVVFILHDVEGYSHEDIAEMTGVASGTSKAQLHRARMLLRKGLSI